MVRVIINVSIYCLALREVLKILGLSSLSNTIASGFGYSSLLIGWGLKELFIDVLAGVALIFSDAIKEGNKISIGDQQYDVLKCGVRSVAIRRIRDGETEVVPNSKIAQERVVCYEGWEKRRCQLNVVIDANTEANVIDELKGHVNAHVFGGCFNVKPSEPCIYVTNFTKTGGIELECVFYILEYKDDIERYKKVNDSVAMG
eukprot:CAMPEP_0118667012 /NCGR_PEP_ID=MMETSP0785-20121206/19543_1 /TAXON_ID=91992 /ORGANISM="Bolidomonas pacifica, Strain CCMP 1866" /LENGTH=201 /DNA_ID=CAMNT_0006561405 /DNA_START=174 /DNA_END=775 /DNA_ORIENTATION=-